MTYAINDTITDLPTLFKEVSGASSNFAAGILIFIWVTITLTGYFAQDRKTGKGNMSMWMTIGGFFTTAISFIMILISGIINVYISVTCLALFILCAAWFLFNNDN